jgi:hypothetical protein
MPFEAYNNILYDQTKKIYKEITVLLARSIQNSRKRHFQEHTNSEIPCPQCFLRAETGASKEINLNELAGTWFIVVKPDNLK